MNWRASRAHPFPDAVSVEAVEITLPHRYICSRTRQLGNPSVIPGSQKWRDAQKWNTPSPNPEPPSFLTEGSGTPRRNTSDVIRKVLFYGYSYRWLQPRDDMTVEHWTLIQFVSRFWEKARVDTAIPLPVKKMYHSAHGFRKISVLRRSPVRTQKQWAGAKPALK